MLLSNFVGWLILRQISFWKFVYNDIVVPNEFEFLNFQDVEGKTALHHAIENGHQAIIGLLLDQSGLDLSIRDKSGLSPFAAAMTFRNNVAARRILQVLFKTRKLSKEYCCCVSNKT